MHQPEHPVTGPVRPQAVQIAAVQRRHVGIPQPRVAAKQKHVPRRRERRGQLHRHQRRDIGSREVGFGLVGVAHLDALQFHPQRLLSLVLRMAQKRFQVFHDGINAVGPQSAGSAQVLDKVVVHGPVVLGQAYFLAPLRGQEGGQVIAGRVVVPHRMEGIAPPAQHLNKRRHGLDHAQLGLGRGRIYHVAYQGQGRRDAGRAQVPVALLHALGNGFQHIVGFISAGFRFPEPLFVGVPFLGQALFPREALQPQPFKVGVEEHRYQPVLVGFVFSEDEFYSHFLVADLVAQMRP